MIAFFAYQLMNPSVFALSESELKEGIIPISSNAALSSTQSGLSLIDYLLGFARDSIFAVMALLAIGMFLFIGGRLVVARGNPEEFKKALQSFIYAAVGIFLVAFAYAIVRLVAGLDI
ncbi:hypothetical protein GW846_04530 [Candidatus Gracilibacteria bacterium]|nr:hypothetical protein [Candidatus Gracilibacteria bacterium]